MPTRSSPPPQASALHPRHTDTSVTPRRIAFANDLPPRGNMVPPPRVAIQPPPRVANLPSVHPPAPTLLPREPIAHRTCSHANAHVALFAGQIPPFSGRIPTPKSSPRKLLHIPMGFAGLCQAQSMTAPEINNFTLLCRALSVLDPATCDFLEHHQLCRNPRYKPIWDTSYTNELGRLCQGIGMGSAPNSKRVDGTITFFLIE